MNKPPPSEELTNEVLQVMYYEFQTNELLEKRINPETPKAQLDPQLLGTIMYQFLDYI